MNTVRANPFTEHPAAVGETYLAHLRAAAGRVIQDNFPEVGNEPVKFTRLARVEGAYLNSRVVRQVDTFRGCNMAMERSIFDEVGLFDENYTGNAAREESDIAMRLKWRSIEIWLNPDAAAVHLEAPPKSLIECRHPPEAGPRSIDFAPTSHEHRRLAQLP